MEAHKEYNADESDPNAFQRVFCIATFVFVEFDAVSYQKKTPHGLFRIDLHFEEFLIPFITKEKHHMDFLELTFLSFWRIFDAVYYQRKTPHGLFWIDLPFI